MLNIEFLGIGNLLEAPDVWGRVARNPVQQECREPLMREDRSSREQVVYGLPLLLSAVPRQRRAKLPETREEEQEQEQEDEGRKSDSDISVSSDLGPLFDLNL